MADGAREEAKRRAQRVAHRTALGASAIEHAAEREIRDALHRHPREVHADAELHLSLADRAAFRIVSFMGSVPYFAWQTTFVTGWLALNIVGLYGLRWDPAPFILLNLLFSTQAAYAAPLILLAQNKAAERDRAIDLNAYEHVDEVRSDVKEAKQTVLSVLERLQRLEEVQVRQHALMMAALGRIGVVTHDG